MAATRDSAGAGASGWDPRRLADTPLGHELRQFCTRILGPGPAAARATEITLAEPFTDRLEAVARAAGHCRRQTDAVTVPPRRSDSLADAVAFELAEASAALPIRQREVLALREMLRLSYVQIGVVMNLEPPAVASLLARARIKLREELRGAYPHETAPCAEREQALRVLARRQDSEPVRSADQAWLFAHMTDCPGCERAHAVMLEASMRYRAWARQ
jgi:hypothetical protein